MTTTLLTWDEGYDQRELPSPGPSDVESRIQGLNGVDRTLVTVYRDESHLAVGGSADDGLVVYCTFDNEVFWQLLGETDSDEPIQVVAGGQAGSYPARHVVTLAAALTAANEFSRTGTRDAGLRWEA